MVILIIGPTKSGKRTFGNQLLSRNFVELLFDTQMAAECMINNTISNRYFSIVPCISLLRSTKLRPFFTFKVIVSPSKSDWRNENDDEFFFQYFSLKKEGILREEEIILNYETKQNNEIDSSVKEDSFLLQCFNQEIPLEHRMTFTDYFIKIAYEVSLRSNCVKRRIGAIIVKDKKIISTGYNGSPFNTKNCFEGGCKRCISNVSNNVALDYCVCIHAEESALLNISIFECKESELYTTHFPCQFCAKKIIQCKIKCVYYVYKYSKEDDCVEDMFEEGGVKIYRVEQKYL